MSQSQGTVRIRAQRDLSFVGAYVFFARVARQNYNDLLVHEYSRFSHRCPSRHHSPELSNFAHSCLRQILQRHAAMLHHISQETNFGLECPHFHSAEI